MLVHIALLKDHMQAYCTIVAASWLDTLVSRFTCVEAESAVQAMFDVPTRHRHASSDAVHVCQCKPDIVELVEHHHVERRVVVLVLCFSMLLLLLTTSTIHLDKLAYCCRCNLCAELYVASRPLYIHRLKRRRPQLLAPPSPSSASGSRCQTAAGHKPRQ